MGTRADFYIGRGGSAEWIGSISYDGDPKHAPKTVVLAKTAATFRHRVSQLLDSGEREPTKPSEGWPWPWDDSRLTDYTYAFDGGRVWISPFGQAWRTLEEEEASNHDGPKMPDGYLPDMSARKRVTLRGVMLLGFPR